VSHPNERLASLEEKEKKRDERNHDKELARRAVREKHRISAASKLEIDEIRTQSFRIAMPEATVEQGIFLREKQHCGRNPQ